MLRYLPQVALPEIGSSGQEKLAKAKVLIVGAGGLGTPLACYLAASGVGSIGIIDADSIAISNLSRQFFYNETEVGQLKVDVLSKNLKCQNPFIEIQAIPAMINKVNVRDYISCYDIVCDCSDNPETRLLVDECCGRLLKPLVYAVVREWEGYVSVLHHTKRMTVKNLFSDDLSVSQNLNCSTTGILSAACGIAGSIQAAEAIKIVIGIPSELDGGILAFSVLKPAFKLFKLK